MSLAEELLNSVAEVIPEHDHIVSDSDTYFIIDPITRQIENVNSAKNVIMQYDHNSERFTFELPRYVDGHDMLECTSVTVNVDNIEIGVDEPRINSDAPDMTDLRAHPNNPDKVISSWLVSRNSTQLPGILSFHIEYKCVDSNGNVVYEWSTDSYDGIEIRPRKKNGSAAVLEYNDVLEQWRSRIFGAGDTVMANIEAEGKTQVAAVKMESETQQEAVELKGAQTLDSIPEDYTETNDMADEAVRIKADAIVCEASGESIVLKDSSNDHIRGLKLYGKTTQFATTGAQLAYISDVESYENNGIVWSSKGGIVTAKGNAQIHSYTPSNIHADLKGLVGTFYLSGNGKYIKVAVQYTRDGVTNYVNGSQEFTLDGTETRVELYCQITTYNTDIDDTAYPMVNVGNTALPYEPYTGGKPSPNPEYPQEIVSVDNPTVNILTGNILDVKQLERRACATLDISDDGYTVKATGGTTGPYVAARLSVDDSIVKALRGQTVIFSMDSISSEQDVHVGPQLTIHEGKDVIYYASLSDSNRKTEVTFPDSLTGLQLGVYVNNVPDKLETDNSIVVTGIMMSLKESAWEPHKNNELAIAHTLPGIPVSSGGNYTDSDGQQWICDEIDLERGVYVQRIKNVSFNGDENWYQYGLYENGAVIYSIYSTEEKPVKEKKQLSNILNFNWTIGEKTPQNSFAIGATGGVYTVLSADAFPSVDDWKALLTEYNMNVRYIRSTPIETPLTAEEITAFKTLRTNYPNTTILNDAGAWMSVKYNADTKSYIENPKTLKLVDSSTGVVYELKIVDGQIVVNPV